MASSLPSTANMGGVVVSRIQTRLPRGSIVTTPRHQVDLVVTEYGAAELRGRTVEERAAALAAIAHPEVRDALRAGEDDVVVGWLARIRFASSVDPRLRLGSAS